MHRRRRRTAIIVSSAALLAAAPFLTGCGNDAHPGAAATVGNERITVTELQTRVNDVRDALRGAVQTDAQYEQVVAKTANLARSTLQTMVLDRVLHRAATDSGVAVSRNELQTMRAGLEQQAGGAEALETGWLQQYGVAPMHLDESLRTELEAQKLAEKLGVDMNTPDGKAAFWKHLSKTSKSLKVDMNPRYGTWDAERSARTDAKMPWLREITNPVPQQEA